MTMQGGTTMTFGLRLKLERIRKGLSQQQVEAKGFMSDSHLSKLEQGRITNPSAKIVYDLCQLYGCSMEEMCKLL